MSLELLQKIYENRFDMSDYLIHFTRKNDDSTAFQNLKKIIKSGKLNAGWSVRNTKRTIFGKYPAVCFTEMPLFSFLTYVQNRNDIKKIDLYGIAISKDFMFKNGARNVIYGLTRGNNDETHSENGEWFTPHLPEEEQYRYMLTDFSYKNDWTHEREWRWRNSFEFSKGDYFPIWKNDEIIRVNNNNYGDMRFNQDKNIYIIVRNLLEADELKEIFKSLNSDEFNPHNIEKTYAIVIESIEKPYKYDLLTFEYLIQNKICIPMYSV